MFRVIARQFGVPIDVLRYEARPAPVAGPGEVLVRMRLSAINPSDLIPVTGAYRHRTSLPFIPGYDGVGAIAAVGADLDPSLIGRRVLPIGSAGNWATWKTLPARWCIDVPDDITDEQAASAYINPLTAKLMVQDLAPAPGDRIGITAAASSIGRMLIRLLLAMGASPVAVVRSERSQEALGEEPIETFREGSPLPLLDGALDAVGGAAGAHLARAIKPGGTMLHYGLLSGRALTARLLENTEADVRLFHLRNWVNSAARSDLNSAMCDVFQDISSGISSSPIEAIYPLHDFGAGLQHNERRSRQGKILLRP